MGEPETFCLSSEEAEYFASLAMKDESFSSLLRSHSSIRVIGRKVVLERTDVEVLRDYFTERLARVGFDANYSPNEEGAMLEKLIDRFFLAGGLS